jgi:hypothetical protein
MVLFDVAVETIESVEFENGSFQGKLDHRQQKQGYGIFVDHGGNVFEVAATLSPVNFRESGSITKSMGFLWYVLVTPRPYA